jgi:cytochrome c peroxidase
MSFISPESEICQVRARNFCHQGGILYFKTCSIPQSYYFVLMKQAFPLLLIAFVLLLSNCRDTPYSPVDHEAYELNLPEGFPNPDIPEDNKLTVARVELGRRLFREPMLSVDSSITCVSCHIRSLAFADSLAISPGVKGRLGFRNSPTLANVAYLDLINKDGGVPTLDIQSIVPIEDHAEMDLSILFAAERLNADPSYREDFMRAYGEQASPFTITRALAAFMRTLISGDSRYDQAERGQVTLTAAEARGQVLFFSDRTQCSSCHTGFNFTDNSFRNNGLYNDYEDTGRHRVTTDSADVGKFRVPTLRNIALTAPYMHDGSLPSLKAVLQHYNQGGNSHANQDPLIRPLGLSESELTDLETFLSTLTDQNFVK